ncbi:hypothetical protein ACYCI2_13195 [Klebsiella michiganensis]
MTDITELAQSEINDALAQLKQISEYPTPSTQYARVLRKYIATMVEALEKAQRANAAQDDHINQQQDRIDTLEKRNAELGGQLSRYSMSPGQADQRACESRAARDALGFGKDADDVAPIDLRERIDGMKARIAELESEVKFPGVMRCNTCGFSRSHVIVTPGGMRAGESVSEHCPNGCGPLWHDTYRRQYNELYDAYKELESRTVTVKLPQAVSAGGQGYQEQVERILTAAGIKVEAE